MRPRFFRGVLCAFVTALLLCPVGGRARAKRGKKPRMDDSAADELSVQQAFTALQPRIAAGESIGMPDFYEILKPREHLALADLRFLEGIQLAHQQDGTLVSMLYSATSGAGKNTASEGIARTLVAAGANVNRVEPDDRGSKQHAASVRPRTVFWEAAAFLSPHECEWERNLKTLRASV